MTTASNASHLLSNSMEFVFHPVRFFITLLMRQAVIIAINALSIAQTVSMILIV